MSLMTPVAFFIFNRPDVTQAVFAEIAKAQPATLLVVADGPRSAEERKDCDNARAVVSQVDWPCRVMTEYSENNLGCKQRVSSGLNWVFSQVEEAIILEDDCVPEASFFGSGTGLVSEYDLDAPVVLVQEQKQTHLVHLLTLRKRQGSPHEAG